MTKRSIIKLLAATLPAAVALGFAAGYLVRAKMGDLRKTLDSLAAQLEAGTDNDELR